MKIKLFAFTVALSSIFLGCRHTTVSREIALPHEIAVHLAAGMKRVEVNRILGTNCPEMVNICTSGNSRTCYRYQGTNVFSLFFEMVDGAGISQEDRLIFPSTAIETSSPNK
jgi:hypothetical protein